MHIKTVDGQVFFATHFVRVACKDDYDEKKQCLLAPFQVNIDGIVCYSNEELVQVKSALQELGIPYTVEVLQHDSSHVEKAKGVKYASRSEAIAHLLEDKEPESLVIHNLRKRLQEKEAQIASLFDELTVLKQKQDVLERKLTFPKGGIVDAS